MKRTVMASVIVLLASSPTYADLAQDLRQLRNTISETTRTGKELGNLVGSSEQARPNTEPAVAPASPSQIDEGVVLVGKIGNVKLYAEPNKKSPSHGTLTSNEEMVYTGTEMNGFYSVATAGKGDGWVEKVLVRKR